MSLSTLNTRPEWLNRNYQGLLISDLDGTLRSHAGVIPPSVVEQLWKMEKENVLRVVATGRSLHSTRRVLPPDFPIDVLIFSSGAGVWSWKTSELVLKQSLSFEQSADLAGYLLGRGDLSFMIHREIPENHFFRYFQSPAQVEDFQRRIAVNRDFAEVLADRWPANEAATQAVVVVSATEEGVYEELRHALIEFSVIRTTSPLDQLSIWIEIFSKNVSKGKAAAWLAGKLGLTAADALVIGNDYNDTDLLEWAGAPFVVANSPLLLRDKYRTVSECESGGAAEAMALWLRERNG